MSIGDKDRHDGSITDAEHTQMATQMMLAFFPFFFLRYDVEIAVCKINLIRLNKIRSSIHYPLSSNMRGHPSSSYETWDFFYKPLQSKVSGFEHIK